MKKALLALLLSCSLFANEEYFTKCGARVPEKKEPQVMNPDFLGSAPIPEKENTPPPKEEPKIEWKDDPTIENYEYYDKPNGVRVCRPKQCSNSTKREHFRKEQDVLNPEFI